jgi:hypothetical protein
MAALGQLGQDLRGQVVRVLAGGAPPGDHDRASPRVLNRSLCLIEDSRYSKKSLWLLTSHLRRPV